MAIVHPTVIADDCTLDLSPLASCRACVDICPQGAWVLSDDSLGLDADLCDGCGLCIPACPRGAVALDRPFTVLPDERLKTAFIACREALLPGNVRATCIHAFGMRDILAWHRSGVRRVAITTGNCRLCICEPKGDGRQSHSFEHAVDAVNDVLASREEAQIQLDVLATADWSARHKLANGGDTAPHAGRRRFLSLFRTAPAAESVEKARDMPLCPGALAFTTPQIDVAVCTGCDVCFNLCPEGTLSVVRNDAGESYRIQPILCTACGLCLDVCEAKAIRLTEHGPAMVADLPLRSDRCRVCRRMFHRPMVADVPATPTGGPCPICSKVNHFKTLHQVLE